MNKALAQKKVRNEYDEVLNTIPTYDIRPLIEKCRNMELISRSKKIVINKVHVYALMQSIDVRIKEFNKNDYDFYLDETINNSTDLQKNEKYMRFLAEGHRLNFKNFTVYLKIHDRQYIKDKDNKAVVSPLKQVSLFNELKDDEQLLTTTKYYHRLWYTNVKAPQEQREQFCVFDIDLTELDNRVRDEVSKKVQKKYDAIRKLAHELKLTQKLQVLDQVNQLEALEQNSLLESNNRNTFNNRADIFN